VIYIDQAFQEDEIHSLQMTEVFAHSNETENLRKPILNSKSCRGIVFTEL